MAAARLARLSVHWLLAFVLAFGSGGLERLSLLAHAPRCACCAGAERSCCARASESASGARARAPAHGCRCALDRAPETPARASVAAARVRASRADLASAPCPPPVMSGIVPRVRELARASSARARGGPPGARRARGGSRAFALRSARL